MPAKLASLTRKIQSYQPKLLNLSLPEAAVLLAITKGKQPEIIFTRRTQHLNSHPGQVAFPGGKRDAQDLNLYSTALREAEEEIGLSALQVEPLGRLSDVISLHGMKVTPYVALVPEALEYRLCKEELDAVFTVPIDWLLEDPRSHTDVIQLTDTSKLYVPSYSYQEFTIWGLSAMMLVEFLQVGFNMPIDIYQPPPGKLLHHQSLRPLPVN